jgi:hypothetical protein
MDIFDLVKAKILVGGGKGFYSTKENDAGGMTYAFKATESGGKSVKEKDVNFYDYDGTLLYSYTLAQAQALTELPPLPEREGLVCQGWNWTLDDIKAHNRAVDVGATYITDDGKTRLYIKIAAEGRMSVPLRFVQTVANGVTIDWGDGSATKTRSENGNITEVHTYARIGEYVITLDVVDGCTLVLGSEESSYCVLGSTGYDNKVYCNMLQKVEVGKGVSRIGSYAFCNCFSLASIVIPDGVKSIGSYGFYYCYSLASIVIPHGAKKISDNAFRDCASLASIVIPDGITSIADNAFRDCPSLASIVIPDGITSIADSAFCYCYSLASITIPDGVTSIGNNAFQGCASLASITIPDGVTSIGNNAFRDCDGMKFYDFTKHTAVPTLSNTNAFQSMYSNYEIRVPAALYDEWKAATNWSTYASKIVAV